VEGVAVKLYAKRRERFCAVQWTGVMTPEVEELLQGRSDRPGGPLSVGDWICSASGEDVWMISDEMFRKTYEEVSATGRPVAPSDADHAAAGEVFTKKLDALLVDALRLSPEAHFGIWRDRNALLSALRDLIEDHGHVAARHERAYICEKIKKL